MAQESGIACKYAVVCEKTGPSRYFSHHDMMRFWDRAVHRAGVPIRMTGGFNPRPRIVFPRPLALGIDSLCEMVELEFSAALDGDELGARLQPLLLDGMRISRMVPMPAKKKGHIVVATRYRLQCSACAAEAVATMVGRFVDSAEIWCDRMGKAGAKRVNIRPSVMTMLADGAAARFRVDERDPSSAKPLEVLRWFAHACDAPEGSFSLCIEDTAFALE